MQPDCYPLAQSFRNLADPHHIDADTVTDSSFHFDENQDRTFYVMRIRIGLF
jgi:hypothetical protein